MVAASQLKSSRTFHSNVTPPLHTPYTDLTPCVVITTWKIARFQMSSSLSMPSLSLPFCPTFHNINPGSPVSGSGEGPDPGPFPASAGPGNAFQGYEVNGTWATAIQRIPSEAKMCLIEQAVHYKVLSNMEHEFLVVHASHPSSSKVMLDVGHNVDVLTATQQHTPTDAAEMAGLSSSLRSSARYLSMLMSFCPPPPSLPETSSHPHPVYDSVQVSHDASPEPILALHGPSVPLLTVSFSSKSRQHPSLLHLSILLLTFRTHFLSYALLQYQYYLRVLHVLHSSIFLVVLRSSTRRDRRQRRGTACMCLCTQRVVLHYRT